MDARPPSFLSVGRVSLENVPRRGDQLPRPPRCLHCRRRRRRRRRSSVARCSARSIRPRVNLSPLTLSLPVSHARTLARERLRIVGEIARILGRDAVRGPGDGERGRA